MGGPDQPASTLPDTWKTDNLHDLPTPLVGTGLGLFGLRESPFVDRDDERDEIWEALRDVTENGAFRLVLIAGESGTGKSRLARWMGYRSEEVGATVTIEAHHTPGGSSRVEGLGGLVLRAVRGWRLERDELYETLLETLPPLEDDFDLVENDARALTELVYTTTRETRDVEGPRYHFDSPRQKYVVMERFIRRMARQRSPLVWLDDLQWESDALGFLEYLTDSPHRPSALIVATLRTDVVAERSDLSDRIARLEDNYDPLRLDLEALELDDHRQFINRLLPLAPDLGDRIAKRTEGNPLFAHHLLGDLVAGDHFEVAETGFRLADDADVELPDDIHQLWETRLTRLLKEKFPDRSETVEQSIELAAVLGRHVDHDEWTAACDRADFEIPERLVDELVDRGLADHTPDGWSFTHRMLVESLKRRARSAGRYRAHNRLCARMLAGHYPDRRRQTARRRADHWIETGELANALDPLFVANKHLQQLGDTRRRSQVLNRRQRVLERLDVPSTARARLENDVALANIEYISGTLETPSRTLEQLFQRCRRADQGDLAARCLRDLAIHKRQDGNYQDAQRTFERALDFARRVDDDELQCRIHLSMGWKARLEGDFQAGEQHTRRVLELRPDSSNNYRLKARLLRGWVLLSRGDFREARSLLEELLSKLERRNLQILVSSAAKALGDLARFRGDADEARRRYGYSLTISREVGQLHDECTNLFNLCEVEVLARRFDRVRDYLESIREFPSEITDIQRHHRLRNLIELALSAGLGEWTEFDRHLTPYADGWPDDEFVARDPPWLLEIIADLCREADRDDRARTVLELARDIWNRLGDDEATIRVADRLEDLDGD